MISPDFLDQIRSRVTLSALIGRSVRLEKAGREYRACCPFHDEKSPSFYVNDAKGFYHCFGCQAHGDAIRWMTEHQGLGFIDAVKELAAEAGLDMPEPDRRAAEKAERRVGLIDAMEAAATWFAARLTGAEGAEARAYLMQRGIDAATATRWGFGFAPDERGALKSALARFGEPMLVEAGLLIAVDGKAPYDRFRGRLMIPIRDPRGRVIAFGGRIIGAGEPKYLNSPDTPLFDKGRTLYNLDRAAPAARKADRIVAVEGYMDVVALGEAGFGEAVAPLGTALTETQIETLWRQVPCPILCFDGDAAGQKAAARAAVRALPLLKPMHSLAFVTLPPGQDPDDLVRTAGPGAFAALLETPQSLVDRLWDWECAAAPLVTPEERAGLKARLKAHVEAVQHPDIRRHYADAFTERLDALFARPRAAPRSGGSTSQRRGGRLRWQPPEPPPGAHARSLAAGGLDRSIQRAVLAGLIHRPAAIQRHLEPLLCYRHWGAEEERLFAALAEWADATETLDSGAPLPIKGDTHIGIMARGLLSESALGFTFARPPGPDDDASDDARAAADLAEAIRVMTERPAIEAALDRATAAAGADLTEESFAAQQRLRMARDDFDRRLAELIRSDG